MKFLNVIFLSLAFSAFAACSHTTPGCHSNQLCRDKQCKEDKSCCHNECKKCDGKADSCASKGGCVTELKS